jgi:hypothetical protein
MALRHREETINTHLALLISKMGVQAEAETIHVKGHHRPDVMFTMRGLRVVIEGKFADLSNAEAVVLDDARRRVSAGLAHVAVAVVYPKAIRTTNTAMVEAALEASELKFKIVSESGESDAWSVGMPRSLMEALRRAQESLAKDNVVEETARSLSERLEGIAALWSGQPGTCDRLSRLLGMNVPKKEDAAPAALRRETASKVSALVIANAMIFQEQLCTADGRIRSLSKLDAEADPVAAARAHWNWIWTNINYVPIFQLGERVLSELPLSSHSGIAFRALLTEAKSICRNQAALRHDLMGRIYHWLLHEAKFLGTYYTSVSAATLLLKLALSEPWPQDFGDPAQLAEFKVGDLASGTGTLLMASAQAISDAYINARAETGRLLNPMDLQTLHRALMENVLHGYDVLPSAMHLTASTLALLAPEVSFVRMNLYIMPMGLDGGTPRLGSLDFMNGPRLQTQIALDHSQAETVKTGAGSSQVSIASVPALDLCVMNPPFVRSVGGNLLFGSLPDERGLLQSELKRRVKDAIERGYPSSITSGLGSVFAALADMHLKPGGRLAFVLPAALVSGEAWGTTRKLIADRYDLEVVVISHDPLHPNFSENTALSEVLFVARKRQKGDPQRDTLYVNLWRNPRTIHEALDLAQRIRHTNPTSITGSGYSSIQGTTGKLGEAMSMPPTSGASNWSGALFAQTELARVCWYLSEGSVRIPGQPVGDVQLCALGELGQIGFDRRDIHDAFTETQNLSPYAAVWNHKARDIRCVAQQPNGFLRARTAAAKGRPLKSAAQVWASAGEILLVERVRTNTHRVLAIRTSQPCLGNTWWAFNSALDDKKQKALALWLNSSLSLLLLFGRRVTTQGAWMQMKKPAWEKMPVLDVKLLTAGQLARLADAYDSLCGQELEALSKLETDPIRQGIDAAIEIALGLPSLGFLRQMLAREPGLGTVEISAHAGPGDAEEAEEQESLFSE